MTEQRQAWTRPASVEQQQLVVLARMEAMLTRIHDVLQDLQEGILDLMQKDAPPPAKTKKNASRNSR